MWECLDPDAPDLTGLGVGLELLPLVSLLGVGLELELELELLWESFLAACL